MSKTAGKENQPAGKQGDVRLWLQRPSQKVHETEAATPTGQHIRVTLERTSTGGTRHEAHFERAASGPMSAAERAKKKRVRASLFPEEHTEKMAKESSRKRSERTRDDIQAAADDPAADKVVADAAAERMRADAAAADAAELSRIKAFLLDRYGVQPRDLQELVDRSRADSDVQETGFSAGTGAALAAAAKEREPAANRAALAAHGLPCLTVPYRSCEDIPRVLFDAKFAPEREPHLGLYARVLDGWPGSRGFRKHVVSWLEDMCFLVHVDESCSLTGPSCGYIAARGINLMFAAADHMAAVDLSDAMDAKWVRLGNSVLQNGRNGATFLETQEVYQLIEAFREHDSSPGIYLHTGTPVSEEIPFRPIPAPDPQYSHACMQWPVTVGSSDWVARKIGDAVMNYLNTKQKNWEQHLFVMNTEESGQKGVHWVAIGIEIRWMDFEGHTPAGHRTYGFGPGKRPRGAIGT
jgi:hypothetical protein